MYTDLEVTNSRTYAGFFTAIRHENNRDWWLIHPIEDSVAFEAVLINEKGGRGGAEVVTSPYPPPLMDLRDATSGQLVANQGGDKLVIFKADNRFFYSEFNRETGEIDVLIRDSLELWDPPYIILRGAQISPSGRFIYLSVDSLLYQLDVEAPDFPNNAVEIAFTDRAHPSGRKDDISFMQMGRDCKIYIMTKSNTDFFHIIHRPDEKGEASMPDIRGIRLPTLNAITIPTFPNYRLGTPYENWCDSLTSSADPPVRPAAPGRWLLWPNPAADQASLAHTADMQDIHAVEIYDQMGRQVLARRFSQLRPTYRLDVATLSSGLYYVKILSADGTSETLKMVKME